MSPPLLEARGARVAVRGAVAIPELTLATKGPRVLTFGADALVAALTGLPGGSAEIAGGSLRVLGHDVGTGDHRAVLGMAPRDLPLPARWTVEEYLAWHARLSGAPAGRARTLAAAALERLGLVEGRRRKIGTLALAARRALSLAAAIVGEPTAVLIESPFDELDGEARAYLLELCARATEGRSALVALAELAGAPDSLLAGASDVCVFRDGRLVAHAEPAVLLGGARLFEICVAGDAAALGQALAERGLELHGGPVHFLVRAPEGAGASDILIAAARARTPVTTCLPLLRSAELA